MMKMKTNRFTALLCLICAIFLAMPAQAGRTDEIFFGSNRGQKVLTIQEQMEKNANVTNSKMDKLIDQIATNNNLLKQLLNQQKLTTEAMNRLNNSFMEAAETGGTSASNVALKELLDAIETQNQLLARMVMQQQ